MPPFTISLTPEQSVVLAWLRRSNSAPRGVAPDWQKVTALAELLGVAPYLDYVLRESSAAPPEVLKRFEFHRQVNSIMQIRRQAELRRVAHAMSVAGIPLILLKGMALALFVYPEPNLRPMSDIDALVPPGALSAAREVLRSLGYHAPSISNDAWLAPNGKVQFEVRDHLPSLKDATAAPGLWARALPMTWDQVQVHILAPTDMMRHLGLHLARHNGFVSHLLRLVDVAETVRLYQGKIDFEALTAADTEDSRYLRVVLRLARELLEVPVPEHAVPLDSGFDEAAQVAARLLLYGGATPLRSTWLRMLAAGTPWGLAKGGLHWWRVRESKYSDLGTPVEARQSLWGDLRDKFRSYRQWHSWQDLSPSRLSETRQCLRDREKLASLLQRP